MKHTSVCGTGVTVAALTILFCTTPRADAQPPCPGRRSENVAIIGSQYLITGGTFPLVAGYHSANLVPASVTAANLARYDTVLLNVASPQMGCNVNALSPGARQDLVSWVALGNKLIIYDSQCSSQDYDWLPYPFETVNPGSWWARGTAEIVEENPLSSTDPASPYYVNMTVLSRDTDAAGDANVMVSFDPWWKTDMTALNTLSQAGPVHAYAEYPATGPTRGLIIYNGLDVDYMQSSGEPPDTLTKIWSLELGVPFNPSCLPWHPPCPEGLMPVDAENRVGTSHTVFLRIGRPPCRPAVGVEVYFAVISGPNAGAEATGSYSPADRRTDANGEVAFTYVSNGVAGEDAIVAFYLDANGRWLFSQEVRKRWVACAAPEAACRPSTKCSNLARRYWELIGTSECYRSEDLELWIIDSSSSLTCGPFASGEVVRISKVPTNGTPVSRSGQGCVAAFVEVAGWAEVIAVDPARQVSAVVVVP